MIVSSKYMGFTQGRWCPNCGRIVFPADRPLDCDCGGDGLLATWTAQGYAVEGAL